MPWAGELPDWIQGGAGPLEAGRAYGPETSVMPAKAGIQVDL